MTSTQIIAIVIFLVTMAAIMTEKLHRTVAAVAGALLLILTGVLSVESGFSYVDLNTLGVLIGMMWPWSKTPASLNTLPLRPRKSPRAGPGR